MKSTYRVVVLAACTFCSIAALCACAAPEVVIPRCEVAITNIFPANNDTGVKLADSVRIVFGREMEMKDIDKSIFIDRQVAGGWGVEKVTYTPEIVGSEFHLLLKPEAGAWSPLTAFRLTISAKPGDTSGVLLSKAKEGEPRCEVKKSHTVVFTTGS
jgi:hypothetical protein